jgi:hypothetical protein
MTNSTQEDARPDASGRDSDWLGAMIHPHFTPDINLGHLVQAVVIVTTVGGGILAGYLSLRADLELQRAEFRVALAGHEARLTVAERLLDERRSDDRLFQVEMRAAVARVMQGIGDLRTELVQKQDRKNP